MIQIGFRITVLSLLIFIQFTCWGQELFPVRVDGKYGYIDKSGIVKIKPKYERAFEFSEGLAKVKLNKFIGYINTKGVLVVEAKYKRGTMFSEGLAAVRVYETKCCFRV